MLRDFLLLEHVNDGQPAIAIADENLLPGAIDADIVGIVAQIDAAGFREASPLKSRTEPSPPLAHRACRLPAHRRHPVAP